MEFQVGEERKPWSEDMWQCICTTDKTFENFWTASGQCCDNRRLTIWYIFNIIFLILVLIFSCKIWKERKKRREELENFEKRERREESDTSHMSSASSAEDPMLRR